MGLRDSSRTRVAPVFSQLLMRDPSGLSWLEPLVALPERFDGGDVERVDSPGPLTHAAWWPAERRLPAPRSLLSHLVDHPPASAAGERGKRGLLAAGDPETVAEARRLLAARDEAGPDRDWYVFEGPTSVDAYLETERLLVLVEGKRTESGPTIGTKWMPVRHQILRNIDAAWDVREGKQVIAFFLVEGEDSDEVSAAWQVFARQSVTEGVLEASLPHRTSAERAAIARAFRGVATWQRLCHALGLDFGNLPHEVVTTREHLR